MELTIHADNFSENKNNDLFLFLCELIYRGWFRNIKLEFGPPGHTHNGNDAVHSIHNQIAGNFNSLTLGDFIRMWVHSWRKNYTIPEAVIMEVQYDWIQRYENVWTERLAGFTNTTCDPKTVSAFMFQWSETEANVVECMWKHSASDPAWRGADSSVNTPGFVLLFGAPTGMPAVVVPVRKSMKSKYISQLTGPVMTKVCEDLVGIVHAAASIAWLKTCAVTGKMPYTYVVDTQIQSDGAIDADTPIKDIRADWSSKIKIGVPSREAECFLMEHQEEFYTDNKFWELPADIRKKHQVESKSELDAVMFRQRLPDIRYRGTAKRKQPVQGGGTTKASRQLTNVITHINTTDNNIEEKEEDKDDGHSGSDKEEENGDSNGDATVESHGADFNECKVNSFAILQTEFDDAWGIEVVQVKHITCEEEGNETFQGIDYLIDSRTIHAAQEECLSAKWYKKSGNRINPTIRQNWHVLAYCQKLVTRVLNRKKHLFIPSDVVAKIKELMEDQNLSLFHQKPDDYADIARNGYQREEDDDSD